jgi:uncharacterized membrane protein YqjE
MVVKLHESKSSFLKIMYSSLVTLFVSLFVISLLVVVLSLFSSISSSFAADGNPDVLVLASNYEDIVSDE